MHDAHAARCVRPRVVAPTHECATHDAECKDARCTHCTTRTSHPAARTPNHALHDARGLSAHITGRCRPRQRCGVTPVASVVRHPLCIVHRALCIVRVTPQFVRRTTHCAMPSRYSD